MHFITSFYHFANPRWSESRVQEVRDKLLAHGSEHGLNALILIGSEGINATVCGTENGIAATKNFVTEDLGLRETKFKDSVSELQAFSRFKVQVREEIVTIGSTEIAPETPHNNHVEPAEFHKLIQEGAVVLDTRNTYETRIGKFKSAIDPEIEEFGQFPEKLKTLGLPKDKKILIYCTGGIRCEKAIIEMNRQGFDNVLQLSGGILKYLEEIPSENSEWDGECFVFDRRVAVDHELKPTRKYKLCPHCGDPAENTRECLRCDNPFNLCDTCVEMPERQTCSKNCLHHYTARPGIKGPQQKRPFHL